MTFNAKFKFLNRESKPNYKDPSKTDYYVLFMEGASTESFLCTPDIYSLFANVAFGEEVDLVFDYNPRFRSIRFRDIA